MKLLGREELRWRMKPAQSGVRGECTRMCESGLVKWSGLYRFRANIGFGLGLGLGPGLVLGPTKVRER